MPDLTSIISKPVRNEGEPSFLGSVFNTIDYPRQELFEKVLFGHGKRFGRDVTGGFASGLALDILLDPLNLVPGVGFIKYGGKASAINKLTNIGIKEYSAIKQLHKLAPVFEPARESLRSSTLSFLETVDKLVDLKGIDKVKVKREIANAFKSGKPLSETFIGRKFDDLLGTAKPTGEFAEGKITRRLRRLGEIGVPGAGAFADISKGVSSKFVKAPADPRLLGIQEAENFVKRQAEIAGDSALRELDGKINNILKNNPGMTRKEAHKNILDVVELKQVDPDELLSSELRETLKKIRSKESAEIAILKLKAANGKSPWEMTRKEYAEWRAQLANIGIEFKPAGGDYAATYNSTTSKITVFGDLYKTNSYITHELEHDLVNKLGLKSIIGEVIESPQLTFEIKKWLKELPETVRKRYVNNLGADLDYAFINHSETLRSVVRLWNTNNESFKELIKLHTPKLYKELQKADFTLLQPYEYMIKGAVGAGKEIPEEILKQFPDIMEKFNTFNEHMISRFAANIKQKFPNQNVNELITEFVENGWIKNSQSEYFGRLIKASNDHYVLRAERLDRLKNELAPGVQEAASFIAAKNEELLKQELQLGLPLTKFDGPDLNYIFHRITTEGKEALQNKEIREKFQAFATASIGPFKKRTIRDKTIAEVNEHMGFEFFSDDSLKLLLDRYYFSGQGQGRLLRAQAAIDLFAKPYTGKLRPTDHTSLAKFLKQAGITRYLDVSWKPGTKINDIKNLLKEHGHNKISVPNAIIKEMGLFQEYTRKGPALTKFLKNYDRYNSIMRFWVTSPIPAYHVRNALGNFFNGGILGGAHDIRDWAEGTRLSYQFHHGKVLGDTDRKIINEALAQGVIGRSGLTYETRNALAGVQSDLLTGGKTFRNVTLKLGEFIEDSGRLAVYLNQRKKGASIREAVAHVKKYLFDYENGLTAFEKGVGKRLSFFYTFTRFNIPLQLEQLISAKGLYKLDTVGKVTGFQRRQQNELDRPDYFNRLDTIDLPFGEFVLNMGFPSEDLSTSLSPKFLLSQLPPQMKVPWELIYEKDSFTGADINKLDRSNTLGKMILSTGSESMIDLFGAKRLKGGGYRIHPWIDKIIDATPVTRFKGILDKLFDDSLPEKDRVTQGVLSFMVGSIKNLDQAKKTEFRRRTAKFFREQERAGDVRSFTKYFGITPEGEQSVRSQP